MTDTKYILLPVEPMLVDVKCLAEILSVSASFVRQLDNGGGLPQAIKLGTRKLWDTDEIRAWKNARCPDRLTWMQIQNEKAIAG